MQWLIDLIVEKVMADFSGKIVLWSGAIVDIPDGWVLCDGSNSTPDLRNRFILGAGGAYNVGETGGTGQHNHTFTGNGHLHYLWTSTDVQAGTGWSRPTGTSPAVGTTDNADTIPPYYALAYIMKT